MSRPTDWAPLAEADPVPGDEAEIRSVARRYRDFAAELEEQAAVLTRVSHGEGWDCGAQRAFAATATEISGQLDKVKGRYRAVGEALDSYAGQLVQAQSEADTALQEAKQAQEQVKATAAAKAAAGPAATPELHPGAPGADLAEALIGPRNRLDDAVSRRDHAGRQAASRVRESIDHDGLKDSWWDKVKNWTGKNWDSFMEWVHDHAGSIEKWAKGFSKIATALAIIGTVISFIPVINVLAPAFFAVAAGLTAVSLVLNTMLALSGDGSWVAVGLDLLGLVTFGWGKAVTGGARAAQLSLKSAAASKATSVLRPQQVAGLADDLAARGSKVALDSRVALQRVTDEVAETQGKHVANVAANQYGRVSQAVSNKLTSWKWDRGLEKAANFDIKGFKVSQKVLGMDAEVVVETAGHRALAEFDRGNEAVEAALKTATSKVNLADSIGVVGVWGDVVDKSQITDALGLDDKLTFGRYANK